MTYSNTTANNSERAICDRRLNWGKTDDVLLEISTNHICENTSQWSNLDGVNPRLVGPMTEQARQRNWNAFFTSVDSPFRFTVLDAIKDQLTDTEFWRSLRFIWINCENTWEDQSLIKALIALNRGNPHSMMTEEEKEMFGSLSDPIPVYRGTTLYNLWGLSWSLSKNKAEWFAKNRQPHIFKLCLWGECAKTDVLGLFLERSEDEIFILPQNVRVLGGNIVRSKIIHPSYVHSKDFAIHGVDGITEQNGWRDSKAA